ncbi:MAG: hypothetical protein ACFBSG_09360 [Leptolyngbyaceae cyanobacterium]
MSKPSACFSSPACEWVNSQTQRGVSDYVSGLHRHMVQTSVTAQVRSNLQLASLETQYSRYLSTASLTRKV